VIGKREHLTLVCVALVSLLSACSSGDSSEAAQFPPAGKTYTPAELKEMIARGTYPDQNSPTTQSQIMAFDQCAAKVKSSVDAVKDNYPAEIIVDTAVMVVAKVWTNDGALTLACSQPDLKLVITNASYR